MHEDYALGKMTLKQLSRKYGYSARRLHTYLDRYEPTIVIEQLDKSQPISVVMDATFFGMYRGWFIVRAQSKTLYAKEIKTETIEHVQQALKTLTEQGYRV